MRKVILFIMSMTTLTVNSQTKSTVQEVRHYHYDCA